MLVSFQGRFSPGPITIAATNSSRPVVYPATRERLHLCPGTNCDWPNLGHVPPPRSTLLGGEGRLLWLIRPGLDHVPVLGRQDWVWTHPNHKGRESGAGGRGVFLGGKSESQEANQDGHAVLFPVYSYSLCWWQWERKREGERGTERKKPKNHIIVIANIRCFLHGRHWLNLFKYFIPFDPHNNLWDRLAKILLFLPPLFLAVEEAEAQRG